MIYDFKLVNKIPLIFNDTGCEITSSFWTGTGVHTSVMTYELSKETRLSSNCKTFICQIYFYYYILSVGQHGRHEFVKIFFAIDMRLSILKLKYCAKCKFDIVDTRMKLIEFRRNDRNKLFVVILESLLNKYIDKIEFSMN